MKNVLILGGPGVGKTHYGVVQLEHWFAEQGAFHVTTRPEDLTVFAEARASLRAGRPAAHTSDTYDTVTVQIESAGGEELELVWPDYSGEQINRILENRRMSEEWLQRVRAADLWLLLIRPSLVERADDLLTATSGVRRELAPSPDDQPPVLGWDQGARIVELLQIFLDAARGGERADIPRLAVLLSCWDELSDTGQTPRSELEATLPMLLNFIEHTWKTGNYSMWGLSALGRALDANQADAEYAESGPAAHGHVLRQNGDTAEALDEPIAWILNPQP